MRAPSGAAFGSLALLLLVASASCAPTVAASGETLELQLDSTEFERSPGDEIVLSGIVGIRAAPSNGSEPGRLAPYPGATVQVQFAVPGLQTEYWASTDDNGLFAITVPGRAAPGHYRMVVTARADELGIAAPPQNVSWNVSGGSDIMDRGVPVPGVRAIAAVAAAGLAAWVVQASRRR